MSYMDSYKEWINDEYFDKETKEELKGIEGNEKEIQERFYRELEFGTAGLRGIIGAGSNRMNIYTVGKATQGFADFLNQEHKGENISIAIAYDPRNMSKEFAERAGLVMAANGIKAYVFDELRPTPELSFAVRYLKCHGGIVITASHNPPEYNGYKVYGSDGGQIPAPKDGMIIDKVNEIEKYSQVKVMDLKEAMDKGLFEYIGEEVDKAYIEKVKEQCINTDIIEKMANDIKVVFTPLHGTGNKPVRRVLDEIGIKNVYIVPEQELPDPNFTTVGYPNPEDPKVFNLAIEIAKKEDADAIIGTDPDADRIGVVVKDSNGEYTVLSGNVMGTLIAHYILSQKKEKGILETNGALLKSIVTTEMVRPIAKEYGVKLYNLLTGFKYIGEKIKEFEQTGEYTFQFGFEESYGCLKGTHARDKDAIVTAMMIAEIVAYYKSKGMTLYDGIIELYKKYGYYKEAVTAISLQGIEGLEKIKYVMKSLRDNSPTQMNGQKIEWVRDYTKKEFVNLVTGEKEANELPSSDVLYYTLEDGSWVCVRPSGTEPKLKTYYGIKGETLADAEEKVTSLKNDVNKLIEERMI